MRARHPAVLALAALATAVGCGSDSKDSSDLESKAPQEVLGDTAAALRGVDSFHLEATQGSGKKATNIKADVALPKKLRLAIVQGDSSATILAVDGSLYIKANAAFWKRQQGGRAADKLADRWLKSPTSSGELRNLTKELDPAVLSHCLLKDHGTLAGGGSATVDGQSAVVIVDKGDRPGTSPGKLFVAATGKPLPLRTIATGTERPGGTKDPQCDNDTRSRAGDEVNLSDYNKPFDVTAPPSALDLGAGTAS